MIKNRNLDTHTTTWMTTVWISMSTLISSRKSLIRCHAQAVQPPSKGTLSGPSLQSIVKIYGNRDLDSFTLHVPQ